MHKPKRRSSSRIRAQLNDLGRYPSKCKIKTAKTDVLENLALEFLLAMAVVYSHVNACYRCGAGAVCNAANAACNSFFLST